MASIRQIQFLLLQILESRRPLVKVYKTNTISTIVDDIDGLGGPRVYKTNTISTIVDRYEYNAVPDASIRQIQFLLLQIEPARAEAAEVYKTNTISTIVDKTKAATRQLCL